MTIDIIAAAIRIATPLLFAALGGLLSERSGVFAVGLEGMMLAGAFAAIIGASATGSALGGIALAIVGGAIIATAVAVIAVRYRADHMVTGLAANILALGPTSYLLRVIAGGGAPPSISIRSPPGRFPISPTSRPSGRCSLISPRSPTWPSSAACSCRCSSGAPRPA